MPQNTDVIILVGGLGSRLRPLTLNTPKPLLNVAGYPFLQHLFSRIQKSGFKRIILSTSYKAEYFEKIFGNGSKFGLDIEYVFEEEPLGTGGALTNVVSKVKSEKVVVCNGDVLGTTNISKILNFHNQNLAELTLHLVKVKDPRSFGSVPTDKNNRVLAFLEKTQDPPTNQINAGCYIFNTELIEEIPKNQVISLEREIFPRFLEQKRKVHGYIDRKYWRDMGTSEDFIQGSSDIVRGIAKTGLIEDPTESFIHPSANVHKNAVVIGGSSVGENCVIEDDVRIDGAVIFAETKISKGATIERSIIAKDVNIGEKTLIRDTIVGNNVVIGDNCEFLRGARIWPNIRIPNSGIRFSPNN